ncbi:MAG: sigma-54-dependent Fis family transcriptional regulator [Myxococcales bacterium]|nr:sigma-54-dependent Fis family transcriptional regulator [Myxococcales bacterium]
MGHQILVVDDDRDLRAELARGLGREGFVVETADRAEAALAALERSHFDAVVTDVRMGGMDGIALCRRILDSHPTLPVIVVTGFASIETAVATLRAGAADFLTKPYDLTQLRLSLDRSIRLRDLEKEVRRLRASLPVSIDEMLGESACMRDLSVLVGRVAPTDATILITGESGVGKELVARAIHQRSPRADRPFVAINCAALPEGLLESELFGHERGAFTDARARREGLFVAASSGTLFLDELGEMPLAMQAKLLRALEGRTVRPVGGTSEVPFDVRIVAATNRDLESAVAEGRFREDLFFRIAVVHVEVPPLRSRGADALVLARFFLDRFASRTKKSVVGFTARAAEKLLDYPWPGNVRELQNCVERAVALTLTDHILVEDLPPRVREHRSDSFSLGGDLDPTELVTLEEVERRYLLRVLEAVRWNKTEATRILGLDRSTLYRKIERYGLAPRVED